MRTHYGMTERLFCHRDYRECDRPSRSVMSEVMEPYCSRLMLFISKCLLYDALLYFECSFMNNVPQNLLWCCNFLFLYKNSHVNRSGEISSLHKNNYGLLFFLSILCKALNGLHVDFSFFFTTYVYILTLVACKLLEVKSMKYLARIKLIQFE